jgi:hypothetical protein
MSTSRWPADGGQVYSEQVETREAQEAGLLDLYNSALQVSPRLTGSLI